MTWWKKQKPINLSDVEWPDPKPATKIVAYCTNTNLEIFLMVAEYGRMIHAESQNVISDKAFTYNVTRYAERIISLAKQVRAETGNGDR